MILVVTGSNEGDNVRVFDDDEGALAWCRSFLNGHEPNSHGGWIVVIMSGDNLEVRADLDETVHEYASNRRKAETFDVNW